MSNDYYAAVREKRDILRGLYGGMMSLAQLTRELGYSSTNSTRAWLSESGLEAVRIGRSTRYETDQVAKIIVNGRGMC